MSNFDDIFESTPQTDEFDKEAWAAKKKAERTRFTRFDRCHRRRGLCRRRQVP